MASHESFYTSVNPTASSLPPHLANNGAAPPPPPKSLTPSRTGTPTVPPIPPQTNPAQFQSQNRSSPAPPPLPQTPASPFGQGQPQTQTQPQYQAQQQPQQSSYPQTLLQDPTRSAPPLDSGWIPESLKEYSTAELQPLINNPELLDAFAKQNPAYTAALEPLQFAVSTNLALAQHVAQLETQVQQLRDQTNQLLLNHTSLQTQWRRKQSETDNALSPWGPRAMYSRLVSSINEQEALLSAVHESFVDGGGEGHEFFGDGSGKASEKEVTEWVKRIREGTTTLEKRREMRQRWDEGRVGGWR